MFGALVALAACRRERSAAETSEQGARPEVLIVEEADRRISPPPVGGAPRGTIAPPSTVFDGSVVRLQAARGETVGLTVWQAKRQPVRLRFPASEGVVRVSGFEVQRHTVSRPSTAMYGGGSRGAGDYPDALIAAPEPSSDPAYFDLAVSSDAAAGMVRGELEVEGQRLAVELTVRAARLPPLGAKPWVWGYYDPRELAWQSGWEIDSDATFTDEVRCAAMFREHGVMATPELTPVEWSKRRDLVAGSRYVPVMLPSDPHELRAAAKFWAEALAERDQYAFAIPIDEPRTDERRREVRALGEQLAAARATAGAPRLLLAVTDEPRATYGDAVDVFISPRARSRTPSRPQDGSAIEPRAQRWTYNGNPPYAGSMVLDAGASDLRTWGWIGWRWQVPLWYIWDVLYWHDRHNAARAGLPRPGRGLSAPDSVTFDDGEDHGNFDGVLALPGPADNGIPCLPTLRLKVLRRGLQDRQLLEAASCSPESAARAAEIAAALVPFALGDAFAAAWRRPITEAAWSAARAQLLELASSCAAAAVRN